MYIGQLGKSESILGKFQLAGISLADTQPPLPSVSISSSKISAISGKNIVTFSIDSVEPFVEYQLRLVPSSSSLVTEGTLVETNTVSSTTSHNVDVTYAEVVGLASEGSNTLKAFVKDAAGNWST